LERCNGWIQARTSRQVTARQKESLNNRPVSCLASIGQTSLSRHHLVPHARATRFRPFGRPDRPEPCDKHRYLDRYDSQARRLQTGQPWRLSNNDRHPFAVNRQPSLPPNMMDSDWYASLVPSTTTPSENPAGHRRRASLLQQPHVSCSCSRSCTMPWYVGRALG
jgi:hypothetical protein